MNDSQQALRSARIDRVGSGTHEIARSQRSFGRFFPAIMVTNKFDRTKNEIYQKIKIGTVLVYL